MPLRTGLVARASSPYLCDRVVDGNEGQTQPLTAQQPRGWGETFLRPEHRIGWGENTFTPVNACLI